MRGAAKSWTQLSSYHKDPLLSLPLCKDVYSNPCVCVCARAHVCVCVCVCLHVDAVIPTLALNSLEDPSL